MQGYSTSPPRDLNLLPKAHLHLHFTGSMRSSTLIELASRQGFAVPDALPPGVAHDWSAFQSRYDLARAVLRTTDDLVRVVTEALADDAADGCGWQEIQIDPTGYPMPAQTVIEAILDAIPKNQGSLIVASSWGRPPEVAERLATIASQYAHSGVTGFGLSNDERLGTVADFVPAARIAADAGLRIVQHAGFYDDADRTLTALPAARGTPLPGWHVHDCVTLLGAQRIGHGLTAATDPSTLDLLAQRRVTIECCPTSYPPLGVIPDLTATPLRAFLDAGVPVALGSDDPLIFGAGLTDQYAIARHQLALSDPELAALARHSITGSSAPPEVQARLLSGVDAWLL